MLTAILAAMVLYYKPVFNFESDKGIYYTRSFQMDAQDFYTIQTDLKTGVAKIEEHSSVKGFRYCAIAMLVTGTLTLLCVFRRSWRRLLALLCALSAAAYLILVVYYAIYLADTHYVTLYPNAYLALPILVLLCMLLLRSNIVHDYEDEDGLGHEHYLKNPIQVKR